MHSATETRTPFSHCGLLFREEGKIFVGDVLAFNQNGRRWFEECTGGRNIIMRACGVCDTLSALAELLAASR